MPHTETLPTLECAPAIIVDNVLSRDRRVLLLGEPGIGKSTLAAELARTLWNAARRARCIGADPGAPTFGIPGAVCRGEWQGEDWSVIDVEALCTLDAGRFRLPLISAVRRLAAREPGSVLLVDAPGVVRGVGGAELFRGLVEAAEIDVVLALVRQGRLPLPNELSTGSVETWLVKASPLARHLNKRERARRRTRLWNTYLHNAQEHRIPLSGLRPVGTPPPLDIDSAWSGRQVALLDGAHTMSLGEVIDKDADQLRIRMPGGELQSKVLLVRDARRNEDGLLNTVKPFASSTLQYIPPPDVRPYPGVGSASGPSPVARVGAATVTLVNGIFGDPLLHVRLRHQKRSLLFDLGEGGRLPARVAHQVSDVFISHAHMDHIAGFLWLLRSRIGDFPPCRLFGPPGLADHIEGLVRGILWDRIEDNAPRFEVAEFHKRRLLRFAVRAGRPGVERLGEQRITEDVVLPESSFRVRALTLDHGTPVLAFAFEQPRQFNIRKERLNARGLAAGRWLTQFKQCLAREDRKATIRLPDHTVAPVGVLAEDLVLIKPGQKLVYATDLANTADNRARLTALAKDAHTFFCEASFVDADAEQALRTGHLTARACGEIATAAGVTHLVPFHFSRRYEDEPERVYDEIRSVCSRVVVPR